MRFISNLVQKYKRATPKQLVLMGIFMLAFAGAIGGGLASKQLSSASTIRDHTSNSIDNADYAGGPGAADADELVKDIKHNVPSDLNNIYDDFGLQSGEYERFKDTVRYGTAYQNGNIVVDGETVMTDAWSIGRSPFSYSHPITIDGKKYYKSAHTDVLKQDLPVMVMFDKNGTVEFAVINACGNPVGGKKKESGAKCESLVKTPVNDKENTYQFSTNASTYGFAKLLKFEYYYNDGSGDKLFATTTSASKTVEKTFTKSATVKVKVTISLPGKQTKTITSTLCEKDVNVVKEEFFYTCDNLYATSGDNLTFRFNVQASHSANVTLVSADFTLDGKTTAKGVTAKNSKGEIYKDYTFSDEHSHTVTAVVNFQYTKDGHVKNVQTAVSRDCTATVTPKQPPVCKYNPNLPPESPECHPPETCETNPGKGDCELPNTGPAGMASLFAGVSALGAVGHRVASRLRRRR